MIFEIIPVGMLEANCYIYGDADTKEVVVIDPGAEEEKIVRRILENQYVVKYIIATHGHSDHISGIKFLKEKTNAKVAIHENDADYLNDARKNLSAYMGTESIQGEADILLKEGDILTVGKHSLQIIHTPGHTQGGVCILSGNILFSGDTLFQDSIGRTDLPGGNYEQLISSIKEKLLTLDENVKVYPGHGGQTTIKHEKNHNPYL